MTLCARVVCEREQEVQAGVLQAGVPGVQGGNAARDPGLARPSLWGPLRERNIPVQMPLLASPHPAFRD